MPVGCVAVDHWTSTGFVANLPLSAVGADMVGPIATGPPLKGSGMSFLSIADRSNVISVSLGDSFPKLIGDGGLGGSGTSSARSTGPANRTQTVRRKNRMLRSGFRGIGHEVEGQEQRGCPSRAGQPIVTLLPNVRGSLGKEVS